MNALGGICMTKVLSFFLSYFCVTLSMFACSPPFESDTSERNKAKAPIVPIRDLDKASKSAEDSKFKERLRGKWGWIEREPWTQGTASAGAVRLALQCTGYLDDSLRLVTSSLCPDNCTDLKIKVWISDDASQDQVCTTVESVSTARGEKLHRYVLDKSQSGCLISRD